MSSGSSSIVYVLSANRAHLRDGLLLTLIVTVVGPPLSAALLKGVGTWWFAGAVDLASGGVMTLWIVHLQRRIGDLQERTLGSERQEVAERLAIVERMVVPEWLHVAIVHHRLTGGAVAPQGSGLRFSDPQGREIVTIGLTWAQPTLEGLEGERPHPEVEENT